MKIRHAVLSDPGRRHHDNQDSVLALSRGRLSLFAVADGVGGLSGGAAASQATINALRDGLHDVIGESPVEAVRESLRRANADLFARHNGNQADMSASTIVALLFDSDSVVAAHAGDSRAYLCRDGALTRLTEDHSLVAEQIRAGILTPEQAASSLQRHVITRSLGVEPSVEVEFDEPLPCQAGDLFLLCSDGLSDVVPDDELERFLTATTDEAATARKLVALANERGGPDNISVVLARVVEVRNG